MANIKTFIMNRAITIKLSTAIILVLLQITIFGQNSSRDAAVEVQWVKSNDLTTIQLQWLANPTATAYQVFKKKKGVNNWGTAIATLSGSATSYSDNTIVVGESYEYQIIRVANAIKGYGYINAGLQVAVPSFRGKLILLIDRSIKDSLAFEINRLVSDIEGDGWKVINLLVDRNQSVANIKEQLKTIYLNDKPNTKALFILGHVPVPYSGLLSPDGHDDHSGAWPTDAYYGEMDGNWTDASINDQTASDQRNKNIIGDGKFDQSSFPSAIDLQIGRVDMFDLPAFKLTEIGLLRKYLDKDHAYRHGKTLTISKAVVDDNFGYFGGEAFASSGYRSLGGLIGKDSIVSDDYLTSLSALPYKWSYGCGGGWYQGANGIGSTQDIAKTELRGVFTMLFGSYFGDWDTQNNFLRAPLASGNVLTNVWAGRPAWYFHHMGLGENIGFSARFNQNNSSNQYVSPIGTKFVSMNLMGDPTLRNDVLAPVASVNTDLVSTSNAQLTWVDDEGQDADQYLIFVKRPNEEVFSYLSNVEKSLRSYTDSCLTNIGQYIYMIKKQKLTSNFSGSYYNTSQGIFDTLTVSTVARVPIASGNIVVNNNTVSCYSTSSNATSYLWDFGDGSTSTAQNPIHVYNNSGWYLIILKVSNECFTAQTYFEANPLISATDEKVNNQMMIKPNPVRDVFFVEAPKGDAVSSVRLCDLRGQTLHENHYNSTDGVNVSTMADGLYILTIITSNGKKYVRKIIVAHN
jgi:hypothetical protein